MIRRALFVTLLVLALPHGAGAQGVPTDEGGHLNYAFATQLGGGIYRVGGQTIQIYRLTGSVNLRQRENLGLSLKAPVTFGFYNFALEDIVDGALPQSLGTLAVVPTLELAIPAKDNWVLVPFGGLGGGGDFSGGAFNWIYAAGVRSLASFQPGTTTLRLGNRFVYTGYTDNNLQFTDDFTFLETGLDARRGLGIRLGDRTVDGSVFGTNYLYLTSPHLISNVNDFRSTIVEWEFGVTLGTVEDWRLLGLLLPRLGVSYRFGPEFDGIRVIIGNPFRLDSPRDEGSSFQ